VIPTPAQRNSALEPNICLSISSNHLAPMSEYIIQAMHPGSPSLPQSKFPPLKVLISSLTCEMADQSGSTRFRLLFDSALRAYESETGVTLANHRIALELQHCNTIEGITTLLKDQAKEFRKPEKITKSVQTIVSILTPLSSAASLSDIVGLVRQRCWWSVSRL